MDRNLLRSLSKALKRGVGEVDALKMIQRKRPNVKLNKVQKQKTLKAKRTTNKASYRNYTFSPALSNFARTQGAKDKKKRKRRGLGKKLAIGAGIGALGLIGGRYGGAALKGGKLGYTQLRRYKVPVRKNLKHIRSAAKGGLVEQIGQDKALLQELAEKIRNRKADPFNVSPKTNLEKSAIHKIVDILPEQWTMKQKPLIRELINELPNKTLRKILRTGAGIGIKTVIKR